MSIKTLLLIFLLVSGGITLFLSFYASRRKDTRGAIAYMLLMITLSIYTFGYAFELYNTTIEGIYLALKIEYLGIAPMSVFWIIMALQYSGYTEKINSRVVALLFVVPLTTIVMLYTNEHHHLHYASLTLDTSGPFPMAGITKGKWYYIDFIYRDILIIGGNILFFLMMFKSKGPLRLQAITMFVASLIPWVGSIAYLAELGPGGVDINPFFLALTGPFFALALFRFKMFDIIPIARGRVFENMLDPVIVVDRERRIADFNASSMKLFPQLAGSRGKVFADVLKDQTPLIAHLNSENRKTIEMKLTQNKKNIYFNSSITDIASSRGQRIGSIITLNDITTQKLLQQSLYNLATTDDLTGLSNRRHFIDICKSEIIRARRHKRKLSIIILDLDYFKKVNDTYGHQAGDAVLIEIATVFKADLRENDDAGRYGGEEFAIILPDVCGNGTEKIADRLKERIAGMQIDFEEKVLQITASFGISYIDFSSIETEESVEEILSRLLSEADQALYRAKNNGRNRVEFYQAV